MPRRSKRSKKPRYSWKAILAGIGAAGAAFVCLAVLYILLSHWITGSPVPVMMSRAVHAVFPRTQPVVSSTRPPTASEASDISPTQPISDATVAVLKQAYPLVSAGKLDEALAVMNPAIESNPNDFNLYSARGFIYSQQGKYDLERQDLQKALALGDKSVQVKFNLAEIDFVQKNYDVARPEFIALEKDGDEGDLSSYKVFLCDLLGGHDDLAARELEAFDLAGSNASYYFANIASDLVHNKPEEARTYLDSANRIYSPIKVEIYSTSLKNLGYLPLPAPAAH